MTQEASSVIGVLEEVTPHWIRGWAVNQYAPDLACNLRLLIDGQPCQVFRPQLDRPELLRALPWPADKVASCGFLLALPETVRDGLTHTVEVEAEDGTRLTAPVSTVCYVPPHATPSSLLGAPPASVSNTPLPQVSVIVLNRNGAALLEDLFQSWQQHNRTVTAEWIVIDHASTDDSLAVLRRWRRRLPMRVRALKVNQSFAASCNLGASLAKAPHLLFLNNDLIWQQDALPVMLESLRSPDVCAVGMKLHRIVDLTDGGRWSEVQHLGVRFRLGYTSYWPYEIDGTRADECQFSAQEVPVVTGAALLCRAQDFHRVGGFHTDYFYGYEDVEFCLRLSQQTGGRVVCRNDVLALHHHGHTRLSGRERAVTERLKHNEKVLASHVGLWIKRRWWQELLAGTRHLANEPLQIGLWLGRWGPKQTAPRTRLQRQMLSLSEQLTRRFPHARLWMMRDGPDALEARGLHALVLGDPSYPLASLKHRRGDLRVYAWIKGDVMAWLAHPDLSLMDGAVVTSLRHLAQLQAGGFALPCWLHRADEPLHMLEGWRVAIHLPNTTPLPLATRVAASRLQRHLARAGVPTRLVDAPDPARPKRYYVAEVHVHLAPPDTLVDPGALNVVWQLGEADPFQPAPDHVTERVDWVTHDMPDSEALRRRMEDKLGHPFSSP